MFKFYHLTRGAFTGTDLSCSGPSSLFSELSTSFSHIKSALYENLLGFHFQSPHHRETALNFLPQSDRSFLKVLQAAH